MKSFSRKVNAVLQREFIEGTIYRVDLDRVDVTPAGSAGVLRGLSLSGDLQDIKPGDPVRIFTVGNERVAIAGDTGLGAILAEEAANEVGALATAYVPDAYAGASDNTDYSTTTVAASEGWTWGVWSNVTKWSGQTHTTQGKTLINLSADFGIPAGVSEVYLYLAMKDTASATGECFMSLWKDATNNAGVFFDCSGQANGLYDRNEVIVPCDPDGNIYWQLTTTGTASIWITVLGYKTLSGLTTNAINRGWTYLTSPLVNASWNGQVYYSTVSTLTAINAYSAYGVPSGAKAVYASIFALDTGSKAYTGNCRFIVAPLDAGTSEELGVYLDGENNSKGNAVTGVVALDANGNFGYKIQSSGTNTMRCWIQIWGYLLGDDVGVASGWVFQEGYRANTWYAKTTSNVAAKTVLNLRNEFNLPVGTSAVLIRLCIQDTASATNPGLSFAFYKSTTSTDATFVCRIQGAPNSTYVEEYGVVPMDDDGNVWYTAGASGTNSLTVYMICCGYMLPANVERANAATVGGYTPKLSGNDGHVMLTNAYGAFQCGMGTANPAGGSNGDRFFRTDLGWEVMYWNGFWYTTQVFQAQHPWQNGIASNAQLSPQVLYGGVYAVCFVRSDMNYRVNTTNNASNYWTIVARSANLAQSSLSTYHTISTAAKVAGTIYGEEIHSAFPGVEQTSALSSRVEWYVSKTGTPGTLDLGATFYFRYLVP